MSELIMKLYYLRVTQEFCVPFDVFLQDTKKYQKNNKLNKMIPQQLATVTWG